MCAGLLRWLVRKSMLCGCRAHGTWSLFFFFSSRRRHTRFKCDWSSDVCSSDLITTVDLHSPSHQDSVQGFSRELICCDPVELNEPNEPVGKNVDDIRPSRVSFGVAGSTPVARSTT